MSKKTIRFFVSYSQHNSELKARFLDALDEQLAPSKAYRYALWSDADLLLGQSWMAEIQKALADCRLGLLLVSPSFLASRFIGEHELPRFVGDGAKPIIPVLLQNVNPKRHDLKGLQDHQIFALALGGAKARRKSYNDCTRLQRQRFVEELYDAIEARLETLTPA